MAVRVPCGELTVVLGPALVRRRLMAMLDDAATPGVRRVASTPELPVAARLLAVEAAAGASLVLAEGFTDGLDAPGRRRVLDALAELARSGPAVLVDDADAVAALAVADRTLRADPVRGLVVDAVELPALSA